MYNDGLLTFVAESCFVLAEAPESDPLSEHVQELVEGGAALLIVVHLLLSLLARPAVHHTNLPYHKHVKTELSTKLNNHGEGPY